MYIKSGTKRYAASSSDEQYCDGETKQHIRLLNDATRHTPSNEKKECVVATHSSGTEFPLFTTSINLSPRPIPNDTRTPSARIERSASKHNDAEESQERAEMATSRNKSKFYVTENDSVHKFHNPTTSDRAEDDSKNISRIYSGDKWKCYDVESADDNQKNTDSQSSDVKRPKSLNSISVYNNSPRRSTAPDIHDKESGIVHVKASVQTAAGEFKNQINIQVVSKLSQLPILKSSMKVTSSCSKGDITAEAEDSPSVAMIDVCKSRIKPMNENQAVPQPDRSTSTAVKKSLSQGDISTNLYTMDANDIPLRKQLSYGDRAPTIDDTIVHDVVQALEAKGIAPSLAKDKPDFVTQTRSVALNSELPAATRGNQLKKHTSYGDVQFGVAPPINHKYFRPMEANKSAPNPETGTPNGTKHATKTPSRKGTYIRDDDSSKNVQDKTTARSQKQLDCKHSSGPTLFATLHSRPSLPPRPHPRSASLSKDTASSTPALAAPASAPLLNSRVTGLNVPPRPTPSALVSCRSTTRLQEWAGGRGLSSAVLTRHATEGSSSSDPHSGFICRNKLDPAKIDSEDRYAITNARSGYERALQIADAQSPQGESHLEKVVSHIRMDGNSSAEFLLKGVDHTLTHSHSAGELKGYNISDLGEHNTSRPCGDSVGYTFEATRGMHSTNSCGEIHTESHTGHNQSMLRSCQSEANYATYNRDTTNTRTGVYPRRQPRPRPRAKMVSEDNTRADELSPKVFPVTKPELASNNSAPVGTVLASNSLSGSPLVSAALKPKLGLCSSSVLTSSPLNPKKVPSPSPHVPFRTRRSSEQQLKMSDKHHAESKNKALRSSSVGDYFAEIDLIKDTKKVENTGVFLFASEEFDNETSALETKDSPKLPLLIPEPCDRLRNTYSDYLSSCVQLENSSDGEMEANDSDYLIPPRYLPDFSDAKLVSVPCPWNHEGKEFEENAYTREMEDVLRIIKKREDDFLNF